MHDSRLPFNSGTTTKSKVLLYAHLVSHIYVESRIKGGEKSVASNFDPMSLWELTVRVLLPNPPPLALITVVVQQQNCQRNG